MVRITFKNAPAVIMTDEEYAAMPEDSLPEDAWVEVDYDPGYTDEERKEARS